MYTPKQYAAWNREMAERHAAERYWYDHGVIFWGSFMCMLPLIALVSLGRVLRGRDPMAEDEKLGGKQGDMEIPKTGLVGPPNRAM